MKGELWLRRLTGIIRSKVKVPVLPGDDVSEAPLHGEKFASDRLLEHAKYIAHTQEAGGFERIFFQSLLIQLTGNKEILERTHDEFTQALKTDKTLLPSSTEWLLDNYYIVSGQLRQVRQDLSRGFYKLLPKLKSGPLRGYPRVYAMALELISHTDSLADYKTLVDFVNSYQTVAALSSAELWAVPIMLRMVLLDNLRRIMQEAASTLKKRQAANLWANRFVRHKASEKQASRLIGQMFETQSPDQVFLVWLLRGLRDRGPDVVPVIRWLELYLVQEDINLEEVIKAQNQLQATNRVTTGNIVNSLRLLSSLDWTEFFESTSLVERILRQDPSGVYAQMDFTSRDMYRHAVETLSKFSPYNEQETARRAVQLAREGMYSGDDTARKGHVGYYLIFHGRKDMDRKLEYNPPLLTKLKKLIKDFPSTFYLGSIIYIWMGIMAWWSGYLGVISGTETLITLVLAGLPASVIAVGLTNWAVISVFPPDRIPKLEFKDGIPEEYRTMVVVPGLISSEADVEHLTENLEKRYLANRDRHLHFALLTDWSDSDEKENARDTEILNLLHKKVEELGQKYMSDRGDIFYLLHRERLRNDREKKWMGWERKRGKLEELNKILRGFETSFTRIWGETEIFDQIKYVLTLDADTQLPINTARKLVGAIAHPLNKPVIDRGLKRVVEGYGIIQPRVDVSAPSAARSVFARVFTGDSGLDPYSSVVSNVYQDLFGTGVYVGKAIYDVDAALEVIGGRFPGNLVLSHDLLEGSYLRTGLASDIELLEDTPAGYDSFSSRSHRWTRGDWQIFQWILSGVPTNVNTFEKNPLGTSDRWKIFDNLRRSVVPAGIAAFALWHMRTGDFSLRAENIFWLSALFYPLIQTFLSQAKSKPQSETWGSFMIAVKQQTGQLLLRGLIILSLLPYEAWRNTDAILRSVCRRLFMLPGLLEWTTHAMAESRNTGKPSGFISRMWPAAAAGVFGIYFLWQGNAYFQLVGIIPMLWVLSPLTAYQISRPKEKKKEILTNTAEEELKKTAARIWRFFDILANEKHNYLPPDNLQAEPGPITADRTSPTNIVFMLISAVCAYDLGFITRGELLNKIEKTLHTLGKLQRHNGHFMNWYNISNLQPLSPRYISTVDSGNFVAGMIAVRRSCMDIMDEAERPEKRKEAAAIFSQLATESLENSPDPQTQKKRRKVTPGDSKAWKKVIGELTVSGSPAPAETEYWIGKLSEAEYEIPANFNNSGLEKRRWQRLIHKISAYIKETEFSFLYNKERRVFAIGFNLESGNQDDSYYDLLASEARLASFVAIALGQITDQHWFYLGRPLTRVKGKTVLLSWGGSVFEYLMPGLFLSEFENTILDQTNEGIIERQKEYAKSKGIPWGISESGYFAYDFQYNYQYRLFGVPDLGLKLDLLENLVITPYATFLTLPYSPFDSWRNLQELEAVGAKGEFGYYEAVDFTVNRLPKDQKAAVVKSFMAHHQGMSMAGIHAYLTDKLLQKRFHSDEAVSAAELLLQERIPKHAPAVETREEKALLPRIPLLNLAEKEPAAQKFTWKAQVLSNGEYLTVLTNNGTGFSRINSKDITRWRQEMTTDVWGLFMIIRDLPGGLVWSATYLPFWRRPEQYEVRHFMHRVEYLRKDRGIETRLEVCVNPEKPVEIRILHLTNHSRFIRDLDVTTYGEISLAEHRNDVIHQAFEKLFVETDYDKDKNCLLFKRRRKGDEEKELWAFLAVGTEKMRGAMEFETDRMAFLGRGRRIEQAAGLAEGSLSGTTGAVLDPAAAARIKIRLKPGETQRIAVVCGSADSRAEAVELASRYREIGEAEKVFDLSQVHSQIEMRHLGVSEEEVQTYHKLAARIIFPDPALRPDAESLEKSSKGQSGLFPYGISGDNPVVLATIHKKEGLTLLRQLLLAHEFLRMKNVVFDMVVINQEQTGYNNLLKDAIQAMVDTSLSRPRLGKSGGIYLLTADQMPREDTGLLKAVARLVLDAQTGSLADALEVVGRIETKWYPDPRAAEYRRIRKAGTPNLRESTKSGLVLYNGTGGFSREDSNEYVIETDAEESRITPLPWTNVLANPFFGCLLTTGGLGMTWSGNSQSQRLTSWSNDAVTEDPSEIVYIKDTANSDWWTATPLPAGRGKYKIRYGHGWGEYESKWSGITSIQRVFIDPVGNTKFVKLEIKNENDREKVLSIYYYAEWVLGNNREQTQHFIRCGFDRQSQILWAKNDYLPEMRDKTAYIWSDYPVEAFTCDRMEILGKSGSKSAPRFLYTEGKLGGKTGSGVDPAGILGVKVRIAPGETQEVVFGLGTERSLTDSIKTAGKWREKEAAGKALAESKQEWKNLNSTLQVQTPDRAFDIMFNGWLVYQTTAGRMWGRSGFSQSSGAFGFRDQLQDALAFVYSRPDWTRAQILYAAQHQFVQGDAMHWWLPESNTGVRTRISDDFLWLVYVTCEYIRVTGDRSILREKTGYAVMPELDKGQKELFGQADISQEKESLYEHCLKAMDRATALGRHGLPLIGTGDWNDGLNSVGDEGRGESVWLAQFLYLNAVDFSEIAKTEGDEKNMSKYLQLSEKLKQAVDTAGWDGDWYRRAYFDDGTPLGSRLNQEGFIDSISQSWAVISGISKEEKSRMALLSLERFLIRENERLILLLTSPFDKQKPFPGYIQGYIPGIRENGGQYTHAAAWVIMANAMLGHGDRAMELFRLINPADITSTPFGAQKYKAEPYVMAGDVYSNPLHAGRAGWTWYTGSSAWMYRIAVQYLLGLKINGNTLTLDPCIPKDWTKYKLEYIFKNTNYSISVQNPDRVNKGIKRLVFDGQEKHDHSVPLVNDGSRHKIEAVMG